MQHTADCLHCEQQIWPSQFLRSQARHNISRHPSGVASWALRSAELEVRTFAASLSLSMPLTASATSILSSASEPVDTVPSIARSASNDPSISGEDVKAVHAPEELTDILAANPGKLVCLMCKAIGCRPCKMFARKYQRVASTFSDCVFLEVTGDETTNLRKLMIQMGVRATPTFRLYREGECIKTHVGIDEEKLRRAVKECLKENEVGFEQL